MNTYGPIDTSRYKHANDRMNLNLQDVSEASITRTTASDLNLLLDLNLNTISSNLSLPRPIQPEAQQQLQPQVQQQQHQQPWQHQELHISASPNDNCMIYDGDRIVPELDIILPIDGVTRSLKSEVEFGFGDLPQNQFPIKSENNNINNVMLANSTTPTTQSVVQPTDELFRLLSTDNGSNINNEMLANSTIPTRPSVAESTDELFRLLATDHGSNSVPTVLNLNNVTIPDADPKIDNNNNNVDKKQDSMDVDSNLPTDRSRSGSTDRSRSGSPNRSRSGSPNPSASPSSPQNSAKNDRGSPGFAGKRHLPVHHKPARGRGRKQQLESMTFEQLAEEAEERNAKLRQAAKDTRLRRRTREKQLKEHSDSLEKKLKDSHRQVARLQTRKPAKNPKDDCLTPSSTTTSPIFAVPSLEQHRLSKRRHSEPSLFAAPTKKKIQKNTSYPPTMTSSSSTTRGSRTDLAHKRRQDNPTNIQYKQVAVQFANRIKQQEATIVAQKTELQALRNAASLLSTDSNQLDIALTLLQGNNLEKVSKPSIREMIACNIQAQNKLFAAYFSQSSLVVEPDFDNQALGFLQSQKSFLNFIDSHP